MEYVIANNPKLIISEEIIIVLFLTLDFTRWIQQKNAVMLNMAIPVTDAVFQIERNAIIP